MRTRESINEDSLYAYKHNSNCDRAILETLLDIRDILSKEKESNYKGCTRDDCVVLAPHYEHQHDL